MAAAYSAAVHGALQRKLSEVLLDSKVPEAQAKWLIGKGITTVAAFNDLADDRSQVADKIAGPQDWILRTLWHANRSRQRGGRQKPS